MLRNILSDAASGLYERLIDGEKVPFEAGADTDPAAPGSPAHELLENGLAALSDRGESVLVPVEPATAHASLLADIMLQIETCQRQLTDSYREFHQIHERYVASGSDRESSLVNLMTDPNQIILLSYEMVATATEDVVVFNTAEMETPENVRTVMPPAMAPTNPPSIRTIYTPDCLTAYGPVIQESVASGEQARFYADLPFKMNVVGRSRAMVALDRTGLHATLYVRSQPFIDALRMLFELVWERATPYPARSSDNELSPQEQRVITLLTTGIKDEAIARQLNVTVRTVRRHISSAMMKLGAENRFAAGIQAAKRGWV